MSILVLSLLLLLLVGIGALMGRRVVAMERFQNPLPAEKTEDVSSSLIQVTGTIQLDKLARDMLVQNAVVEGGKPEPKLPAHPKPAPNPTPDPPPPAPNPTPGPGSACPDMSQYIRMDEIPCWNCTLP